ncbi:MAG TPA: radical SAM protein [Actinobacteria bacterium]|nr:radical SAM protein [Actinomycetota bacterium]
MSLFYGPVLSRRFGYSLGIDLIPFKVCVYDCIYCQLGRTTNKTTERKKYIDIDFDEFGSTLIKKISECKYLNYITFSGSGEPTLNSDISKLIGIIKKATNIPVAVLTCGGTLGSDDVINDIIEADIIKISLDAPDNRILKKINRPCTGVDFNKNISGLKKLLDSFSGSIWLEIMIMEGINDSLDHAAKFKELIEDLGEGIEKIHINTAVRPSGGKYMRLPSRQKLQEIKDVLGKKAEIIGKVDTKRYSRDLLMIEDEIVGLLSRRPGTIKDIASALGINLNEAIKIIDKLFSEGKIKSKARQNINHYYIIKE